MCTTVVMSSADDCGESGTATTPLSPPSLLAGLLYYVSVCVHALLRACVCVCVYMGERRNKNKEEGVVFVRRKS